MTLPVVTVYCTIFPSINDATFEVIAKDCGDVLMVGPVATMVPLLDPVRKFIIIDPEKLVIG